MLPLEGLEARLGYVFRDRQRLERALTHRSYVCEQRANGPLSDNEQLEFLGDAILGFVVSEDLVCRHPSAQEGALSQLKAHLVSAAHLHACALTIDLGSYLMLGRGEEVNGGRARRTFLSDAMEALIAAIYLDGGLIPAKNFISTVVLPSLETEQDPNWLERLNPKSILQERAQALGLPTPTYQTVGTQGPEHAKVFTVEGRVGETYSARATGTSKKGASQEAAHLLIEQLQAAPENSVISGSPE